MIRVYASDPAYQDIADVAEAVARLTNAHVHWDLRGMPEVERVVALHDLFELWEELEH